MKEKNPRIKKKRNEEIMKEKNPRITFKNNSLGDVKWFETKHVKNKNKTTKYLSLIHI